ncbi:MAG: flagellar hook-basal body complex protein [Planctomycetes bacterium]|nr:flagellar hook-basal body complex protein [Planctomycetota bacterium]
MVSTALFTGLSGLRSHQRFMDVIGNNLANVNTPGFWGSRVTFADLLSFTSSPGQGPSGSRGGKNPTQIGLGVQVGSIDANTNQGTFLNTGRSLDVALQGQGFFALTDGQQSLYTRVGSFGVDEQRRLVDLRTGMRVVSETGGTINVPLSGTLPAQQTGNVSLEGTLPAKVNGPLSEVVSSTSPLFAGVAASKTTSNTFTDPMNLSSLNGQEFTISVNGGTPQTVTIDAAKFSVVSLNTVTFAEFIAGVESQVNGITVTEAGGAFTFGTDAVGEKAQIKFDNKTGNPLTFFGLDTILTSGTQSAATGATLLNDLTINSKDYDVGDQIRITGTDPSGAKVAGTFIYGTDGTTVQSLINFMNLLYRSGGNNGATATITNDGTLTLTADQQGEAKLSLFISDDASTPNTTWNSFKTTRDGTGPDEVTTSIDVYDSLGRSHPVTMILTRDTSDPKVWNLKAELDSQEGTIIDGTINGIRFNDDGSFNIVTDANSDLEFSFNGLATSQTITLDFGNPSSFEGLSMLGEKATAAATEQDGYAAGSLLNVAFSADGTLQGYYSNGKTLDIDKLRIVMFPNAAGLQRLGDTLFTESPNSDDPILTSAGNAGSGAIVAGVLENSNVDIAEEFVRLIEAQRGYQANARVITTVDEVLAELINIVR